MAFNINYLGRASTSGNTQALKVWSYNATATGTNEALATVIASGYFNAAQQILTAANPSGLLAAGDVLHIHGNDDNNLYVVTSITTNVTLTVHGGGTLDANLLQYTTVAITAAEFNGMFAAPKLLVAAGGANTLLVLDKLQLLKTHAGGAFAAGGSLAVQYDLTPSGAGVLASVSVGAGAFYAPASNGSNFNAGIVTETFSTCVNKGFYLSNVSGAFTAGSTSSFVAHIWYKQIPTV